MKKLFILILVVFIGCSSNKKVVYKPIQMIQNKLIRTILEIKPNLGFNVPKDEKNILFM